MYKIVVRGHYNTEHSICPVLFMRVAGQSERKVVKKENGKKSKKGIDICGREWYSNQAVSAVRVTAKQTVEKTA